MESTLPLALSLSLCVCVCVCVARDNVKQAKIHGNRRKVNLGEVQVEVLLVRLGSFEISFPSRDCEKGHVHSILF